MIAICLLICLHYTLRSRPKLNTDKPSIHCCEASIHEPRYQPSKRTAPFFITITSLRSNRTFTLNFASHETDKLFANVLLRIPQNLLQRLHFLLSLTILLPSLVAILLLSLTLIISTSSHRRLILQEHTMYTSTPLAPASSRALA